MNTFELTTTEIDQVNGGIGCGGLCVGGLFIAGAAAGGLITNWILN